MRSAPAMTYRGNYYEKIVCVMISITFSLGVII